MPQAPKELAEPAQFVKLMEPVLDRATALLGGTDTMRAAGEKFLPKFPGEAKEVYDWRRGVAVLNNFFEAMGGQMVGMMFEKPVQHQKGSIPGDFVTNVDKRGSDLNTFAADVTKALLHKGRPHILIDHPKKPETAETHADDTALGLRPYLVLIEPGAVISAFATTEGGEERLEHFRWREWGAKRAGDYGVVGVERIRVLNRLADGVKFEVWEREREGDQFELAEEGELIGANNKKLTEIPVVTLYSDRQSFMVAKPTLDDIAHKNIEHWQSSADQRHILTVSRFPILYQIGTKNPVALVGPYSMYHTETSAKEASIGYAEAEGKGTEHGWKDLDRIVAEAEAMAVRIVTSDAAKTDSGEQIDYAKEGSKLQKLAVELQRGLNETMKHVARWYGLVDAAAGEVTTHKDFGASGDDAKAIDQLQAMREKGDLTRGTLWAECQERGLFKTKFDPKKEETLLEDEKARALETQMAMGGGAPGNENEPDDDDEEAGGPKPKAA